MNEDFDLYEGLDDIGHRFNNEDEDDDIESSEDDVTFIVNDVIELEHSENKDVGNRYVEINSNIISKPLKYAENPNINSYLILSNLDWYITQSQIYQKITSLGPISYLYLFENPLSGKFLGLVLIQFSSPTTVKIALDSLPQMFNNRIKVYELDDEIYNKIVEVQDLHTSGRMPGFLLEKICNIASIPLPNKSEMMNSDHEFEKVQQQLIDAGDFKSTMNLFPWFQFDIFKLLRPIVSSLKNMPNRDDYIKLETDIKVVKSPIDDISSKSPKRRSTILDRVSDSEKVDKKSSRHRTRRSRSRSRSRSKSRHHRSGSYRRSKSRDRYYRSISRDRYRSTSHYRVDRSISRSRDHDRYRYGDRDRDRYYKSHDKSHHRERDLSPTRRITIDKR